VQAKLLILDGKRNTSALYFSSCLEERKGPWSEDVIKDVRAKKILIHRFLVFEFLQQSDNELLVSERRTNLGSLTLFQI